jgi:general secretion pathway protein L
MSDVNQLNLFGLDLSGVHRRIRLGMQQVLWGDEVGLRAWFSPPPEYLGFDELDSLDHASLRDSDGCIQVLVPDAQVLVTEMTLPSNAEIFLEEAVRAHVVSHSPFADEETCWGSMIVDRAGGSLAIDIIIVSRRTAEDAASHVADVLRSCGRPFGLSARTDTACVALDGYQDPDVDTPYLTNLKKFSVQLAVGLLGIAFLATIPAIWFLQTELQYSDLLRETTQRSKAIVKVREALVTAQSRVSEAEEFFAAHESYRPWLHRVAAATPDSVYLNRLAIENDLLTVTGLAVNAADYQAAMVEAGLFSEVTAPTAFTLDSRAKRERFTLTMVLAPGDDG